MTDRRVRPSRHFYVPASILEALEARNLRPVDALRKFLVSGPGPTVPVHPKADAGDSATLATESEFSKLYDSARSLLANGVEELSDSDVETVGLAVAASDECGTADEGPFYIGLLRDALLAAEAGPEEESPFADLSPGALMRMRSGFDSLRGDDLEPIGKPVAATNVLADEVLATFYLRLLVDLAESASPEEPAR